MEQDTRIRLEWIREKEKDEPKSGAVTLFNLMKFRTYLILFLASFGVLMTEGIGAPESPGTLPPGYREVGDDKVAALRELCQATADTGLFSGAVLVAYQGKIIYQEAFGPANREWNVPNTTDTKFRLASVSKPFCTMVVMQLIQEGKLHLDDTITDHLSSYRRDTGDRITIHHLMAHQSGIPDFTASFDYRGTTSRLPFDKDEFIQLHCSGDLLNEPGTIYSYCNAGYVILGRIIEKVTRKSFERNVQERIFEPLGMKNSGYDRNEYVLEKRASGYTRGPFEYTRAQYMDMDSSPGAAGALYSTVEDMFLWDRALYTDQLLEKKFRDLMFTPNRDVPEVKAAGGRSQSRYGYGWQIYTRTHPVTKHRTRVLNHGGAIHGFRAMKNRLVDDDAFVIVLCNQGDGYGQSDVWNTVQNLSAGLMHVVTGQPYRLPGKPRPSQDQRMYEMTRNEGVDATIEWFREKGRKAAWGGTTLALAEQLLKDGRIEEGIRFLELEIELNPGKIWLYKKATEACLSHDRPEKALALAEAGLKRKPDDEKLLSARSDAEAALKAEASAPR